MRRTFVLFLASLLLVLGACKADNEEPFDDQGFDLNWPTTDPDRYHWDGLQDPFFEFWSWHIAIPEKQAAFTITMGVGNPGSDDPETRGGILHFTSTELERPQVLVTTVREFEGSVQTGDVTIGRNRGTQTVVRGSINTDSSVSYDLRFEIAEEWQNTMGLLTNLPILPLNWHVNALLAKAEGEITIDGETYVIDGAPAMEDHLFGARYPRATTRILGWCFGEPDTALAYYGGDLLLGPFELPAVMIALRSGGQLYEFRTQDMNVLASTWRDAGDKLNIEATKGDLRLRLRVLNDEQAPLPGFVIDENGLSEGGSVRQNTVLYAELLKRQENGEWTVFSTLESTQASFILGVEDPYHDLD